ncbi:FtsX-like permease family protein [Chloroflexales bacterium ZM16-3]|nr:FtsX-like permease family protein [Chloroflexales bacterium ZM16-3]
MSVSSPPADQRVIGRLGSRRARRRISPWLVLPLALIIAAGGFLAWRTFGTSSAPAISVSTATVSSGSLSVSVSGSGSVAPSQTRDLAFAVSGTVAEVSVQVGDTVSAGQSLASLDIQELQMAVAQAEVETTMREEHSLSLDGSADDFSVINQQDMLDTVTQTTQMLTLFLAAIAGISLLVGGIGIMNIMLVSVREHTREIGLRKALGAREGDIMRQFLFESLALSGVGGLVGLALGSAIALGVSASGLMTASLSWDVALLAFGFALAVGLFFGIAPARSAARLDPIVALRYE